MTSVGDVIRMARRQSGLTQSELARRAGTTQAVISRLESGAPSPRIGTVESVLEAMGRRLRIDAPPARPSIDETLVARQLRLTPAQRLEAFVHAYGRAREIALAGERARGELA